MNILHISDLHFGPRHWEEDDQILLEKINSYDADIVINEEPGSALEWRHNCPNSRAEPVSI